MESGEIRKRFFEFFKRRGHTIVPSSSLIPDDPSVLLTTAGMQQFKPYYTGDADPVKDFGSKNAASIQKSFRTSDIDEVGDESHLTFFEMLGNFSFGGYFKEEAIRFAYNFLVKEMGLKISYVTIFKGLETSGVIPKDEESKEIWKSLGIEEGNIREEGMEDVFWGPTGNEGPCGPTTEIYCRNASGEDVEIWNIVFNQFFYPGTREELLQNTPGKKLEPLSMFGVDTGMGLERLAMVSQNTSSVFETDLFAPLMALLPESLKVPAKRIISDHARGTAFLIADYVRPSNKGPGYILRRLMRRILGYERLYGVPTHIFGALLHEIIHQYTDFYPKLGQESLAIEKVLSEERQRFSKTLALGIKYIGNLKVITPEDALKTSATYGVPFEIIKEAGGGRARDLTRTQFDTEFEKHQEISRAGQERKFGGHGLILDTGELKAGNEEELKIVTRLHTATHLLNAALHKVLGDSVEQRGSDITAERTRFDFLFPRKLTSEEIAKIEELVNNAIANDLAVSFQELPLEEAKQSRALFFFKSHYPERVNVYTVGDANEPFSRELCGGPHVSHTGEIGTFKIIKEESSSAGVRRIRAMVNR